MADEATHGDDGVGEVEERVDDDLAAFVAALQPVEGVVPGVAAFDVPALAGLDGALSPLCAMSPVRLRLARVSRVLVSSVDLA